MPDRIQRQRTRGWRAPTGAIYVGRPGPWGNPFRVGEAISRDDPLWPYAAEQLPGGARGFSSIALLQPQDVVDAYASWLIEQPYLMLNVRDLAGHDLVCWCRPSAPCHADVLLSLANGDQP